jgi:hypothetical protein
MTVRGHIFMLGYQFCLFLRILKVVLSCWKIIHGRLLKSHCTTSRYHVTWTDMMENKTLYKQHDKDCFISSSTDQKGSSSSLERSTYIKFQLQKTYNGLIWGPNTGWTRSTESPYAFCAKNINIEKICVKT